MKTIHVCPRCGSPRLMYDAYVMVNDPEDVRTFDNMTCDDCGYDGHTSNEVEVPDDFDVTTDTCQVTETPPAERTNWAKAMSYDRAPKDALVGKPDFELVVARMKGEINADIALGRFPENITCFGDLNDYVDANEYGGFCEDALADAWIEAFGGRNEDEGMPQSYLDFIARCQNAVDGWLREGRKDN